METFHFKKQELYHDKKLKTQCLFLGEKKIRGRMQSKLLNFRHCIIVFLSQWGLLQACMQTCPSDDPSPHKDNTQDNQPCLQTCVGTCQCSKHMDPQTLHTCIYKLKPIFLNTGINAQIPPTCTYMCPYIHNQMHSVID